MSKKLSLLIALASFLVCVDVGYAQAPPANTLRSQQAQGPIPVLSISERQAVGLAKQRFPGNVLRITLVGQGQNQRYQIRMENEGRVFTVFVNAASGEVSGGN